jgi:hypothetical protein
MGTYWEVFKNTMIRYETNDYSYWGWIYYSVKLMEKYFPNISKRVHGFIGTKKSEIVLQTQKEGTFLFRFSDSVPGAVSISYVTKGNSTGLYCIQNCAKTLISNDVIIKRMLLS